MKHILILFIAFFTQHIIKVFDKHQILTVLAFSDKFTEIQMVSDSIHYYYYI